MLEEKKRKAELKMKQQKEKLALLEAQKDEQLKAQDEIARKRNAQAAARAKKEEEKLYAEAKKKALEKEQMTLVAEKKKNDLIKAKADTAVLLEQEKVKQRKIAANKANAERLWTSNDLTELRDEFNKFDTAQEGTVSGANVKVICETLGETLSPNMLQLLLSEMKQDNTTKQVAWVHFLNALVPKREAARRKGVGLLEKFGLKKAAAEKKKYDQIKAAEDKVRMEELEKVKQRKIAASKADAERLWTSNDLTELRDAFNNYDTAQEGTVSGANVKLICETLGETLNGTGLQLLLTAMKQDNTTKQVAWVHFLNALVPKRKAAIKKGIGLLEKMGLKKAAAEKKKKEQIKAAEDTVMEEAKKAALARDRASLVAKKKKQAEKEAIVKRNEEIKQRALEEKKKIELKKQEAEKKKEARVKKNATDARKREDEIKKKKANAVKNKAKEREEKKRQAEVRKKLKKQHLLLQDDMKARIVQEKSKGNFDIAKQLKIDLKNMVENQAKELKTPVRPAAGTGKSKAPGSGRKVYNPSK